MDNTNQQEPYSQPFLLEATWLLAERLVDEAAMMPCGNGLFPSVEALERIMETVPTTGLSHTTTESCTNNIHRWSRNMKLFYQKIV